MTKTVAIIVTYHPDIVVLRQLIERLDTQVAATVIVDNGSPSCIATAVAGCSNNAVVVPLVENRGIAAAQNIGIAHAKDLNPDYAVLFDQDSSPEPGMIATLVDAAARLQASGAKVGCVGPVYVDPRQSTPPFFVRIRGVSLERILCTGEEAGPIPVDHLIASGSLFPMATLDAVGGMREDLFIDYVDIEWCERALVMGYQSYGVCAAVMHHSLGDDPIRFMGMQLPARSPLRHYYMFRNAVRLYGQPGLRWNWKVVDGLRLVRKYVFYGMFAKPRAAHLKMMSLGVWHGLTGKMGPYAAQSQSQPDAVHHD